MLPKAVRKRGFHCADAVQVSVRIMFYYCPISQRKSFGQAQHLSSREYGEGKNLCSFHSRTDDAIKDILWNWSLLSSITTTSSGARDVMFCLDPFPSCFDPVCSLCSGQSSIYEPKPYISFFASDPSLALLF